MTNLKTLTLLVVLSFIPQACAETKPAAITNSEQINQAEYSDSTRNVSKYLAYEHHVTAEVKADSLTELH